MTVCKYLDTTEQLRLYTFVQGCGSRSGAYGSALILISWIRIRIQEGKKEKVKTFPVLKCLIFSIEGCSEGTSCGLDVLHKDLYEIFDQKYEFFQLVKPRFFVIKTNWIGSTAGSGGWQKGEKSYGKAREETLSDGKAREKPCRKQRRGEKPCLVKKWGRKPCLNERRGRTI